MGSPMFFSYPEDCDQLLSLNYIFPINDFFRNLSDHSGVLLFWSANIRAGIVKIQIDKFAIMDSFSPTIHTAIAAPEDLHRRR